MEDKVWLELRFTNGYALAITILTLVNIITSIVYFIHYLIKWLLKT